MRRLLLLISLGTIAISAVSQRIVNPAYGLISHETMEITEVGFSETGSVISVSLENRASGGYFCVDPNTFMVLPDGTRLKLTRAEGIPYCPDAHKFTRIGEVLRFKLIFPVPDSLPEWFNLVEVCESNCFSVYSITTDLSVNSRVERAYELAESGKAGEAGKLFGEIIVDLGKFNHGLLGSLYTSVIIMSLRDGDEAAARLWYRKFLESGSPDLSLYIDNLSSRGIKW
jgi:hypothetical protein